MNPFARLETLAPAPGQLYAVVAYNLSKNTFPDPEHQGHSCSGIFTFARAFGNKPDAMAYADHLAVATGVRTIAVIPPFEWKYLSTYVARDQTVSRALHIKAVIAKQNEADLDENHPVSRVRNHDAARKAIATKPELAFEALLYDVLCEEEDVAILRALLERHTEKLFAAQNALATAVVAQGTDPISIVSGHEADIVATLSDQDFLRMKTTLQRYHPGGDATGRGPGGDSSPPPPARRRPEQPRAPSEPVFIPIDSELHAAPVPDSLDAFVSQLMT